MGVGVELKAADTLLERGVRASFRAPLLLRVFGKKTLGLTYRQPTMGLLVCISREYLKMGIDVEALEGGSVEEAHRLLARNGLGVARIAAMGWLRTRVRIRLLTGIVARWMLWRLSPQQLRDVLLLLVTLSGVQDFTTTIRCLRAMNMMSPKELSREASGS
jgi:hypothetical protein